MTCLNSVSAIKYIIFFFLITGSNGQGHDGNDDDDEDNCVVDAGLSCDDILFKFQENSCCERLGLLPDEERNFARELEDFPGDDPDRNNPCLRLYELIQKCLDIFCIEDEKDPCDGNFTVAPSFSFSPSSVPTLSLEPTTTAAPTVDCTCCNCTHSSGCNPDPHYFTWDNSYFDFQGGCDQIAIDNPQLQLQIRTRPRNGWSTVTEVALLMKNSGEFFRYSVNPGPGGSPDVTNTITSANSNADVVTILSRYEIFFLQDPESIIRISDYGGNINIQVVGTGLTFTDSEGMFGSWNYGGVRFQNGLSYDTSGGWAVTRTTSIALAQDWQIPIADNLMSNPSNICEYEPNCANSQFGCSSTTRKLQAITCDKTCDDIGFDPTGLAKAACEEDFAITGGNFFACQPAYQDPLILLADPSDFDPGNAPCNNSPPDEVEEALNEELSSSGTRRSLLQGLRGRSFSLGNGFSFGNNNNNGKGFSYGNGNYFGEGFSFGNDNNAGKGFSFGNGDNAGKGFSFGNDNNFGKGFNFGKGNDFGKGFSFGKGNYFGKGFPSTIGKGFNFGKGLHSPGGDDDDGGGNPPLSPCEKVQDLGFCEGSLGFLCPITCGLCS